MDWLSQGRSWSMLGAPELPLPSAADCASPSGAPGAHRRRLWLGQSCTQDRWTRSGSAKKAAHPPILGSELAQSGAAL
eukprot:9489089-Pyramimonas_sp.AAC.1